MLESANQIIDKLTVEEGLDLNNGSTGPRILTRVQRLTSATKTLTLQDSGTWLFCDYAGAVTITLPTVMTSGWHAHIVQAVDQNLTVTTTADTLCAFNDIAATSVAFSTSSNKTAGLFLVICDGTQYHAFALVKNTLTVA